VMDLVGQDRAIPTDQGDFGTTGPQVDAEAELFWAHAGIEDCWSIMSAMTALMKISASSLMPPTTPP